MPVPTTAIRILCSSSQSCFTLLRTGYWFLASSPPQWLTLADWTQSAGDRSLVTFGGGIGRTLDIASQAVDWNIAFYSNVVRPTRQLSPKWQISLQFTLLYRESVSQHLTNSPHSRGLHREGAVLPPNTRQHIAITTVLDGRP